MVETQQSKDTLWNGFPHIPLMRSSLHNVKDKVKVHLLDTSCTTKRTSAPPHDFSGPETVNTGRRRQVLHQKLTRDHFVAQLELFHHLLGDNTRSVKELQLIIGFKDCIDW